MVVGQHELLDHDPVVRADQVVVQRRPGAYLDGGRQRPPLEPVQPPRYGSGNCRRQNRPARRTRRFPIPPERGPGAPNQPTTASFTVVNDGGSVVTVPYFLAGNRNAVNANVDFPAGPQVTLAPGQSYTYQQSRTLAAGNYTAWPAYFDGSTWIQLADPSGYTVP
jgi:hypothetical protein